MIIPYGVYEEIIAYRCDDRAKEWATGISREHFNKVEIIPCIASWDLGKGESQVISLAYNLKNHGVILDDKPARYCANIYKLPLRGTIGVLIESKRHSIIDNLEPYLVALKQVGFRLSDTLIKKAIEISQI